MTCTEDKQEHGGHCCKKCPKGHHVSSHCQESTETRCAPCDEGYFTEHENYIDKCFSCRSCHSTDHLNISEPCTTKTNTKCMCMDGYYCTSRDSEDHCEKCEPVRHCPPGQGVSVPPNSTHDTVCEPCPNGTFNNNTDYLTPCRNHTSCSDLGRHFISHGTAETDAKCGRFMSRDCHWMIPASLWAGLILTLILVSVVVVCLKCKRRRKAVITSVNTENFIQPALPPDVIKYPNSPELQIITLNKLCPEEDDCALECDGISVTLFSGKCGTFSVPLTCDSYISEPFRSEPQEDDWPGL